MDRWEVEKRIVMKALKDPAFKKKLLSNPKEALKECFKNEKGFDSARFEKLLVRAIEEKQGEWVLSLPYIGKEHKNLSDSELEKLFAAAEAGCGSGSCCLTEY